MKFKSDNSKKQIENIVIFIILLVIVIIVIDTLFGKENNDVEEKVVANITNEYEQNDVEYKLENILSKISGVGNVDVMVSYSNTIENVPMYDTKENTTMVEEADVNGGKRTTKETQSEQNIIFEEKSNSKIPAIRESIEPKIIGVIVVADGANNSVVKENIKNAVEAVCDIPSHRIQVFSK